MNPNENSIDHFKALLQSEVNLREDLAAQLHKEIFPLLSIFKINYSAKNRQLDNSSSIDPDYQQDMKAIDEVMDMLRVFYYKLYPSLLKHLGLLKAIHSVAMEVSKKHSVRVNINYDHSSEEPSISKELKFHLFCLSADIIEYLVTINCHLTYNFQIEFKEGAFVFTANGIDPNELIVSPVNKEMIHQDFQGVIKGRLMILKGIVEKETNWIDYLKVLIPINIE